MSATDGTPEQARHFFNANRRATNNANKDLDVCNAIYHEHYVSDIHEKPTSRMARQQVGALLTELTARWAKWGNR